MFDISNLSPERRRAFCLAGVFLLFLFSALAQCPGKSSLWNQINAAVQSNLPAKKQLTAILPLADSADRCYSDDDSIRAFLYKRIGALYYQENDYVNALKYYPEFIKITRRKTVNLAYNQRQLSIGYYWLSMIYEGLNRRMDKMKALDSCVYFAERSNNIDRTSLRSLYELVEYYFDMGDYHRSIEYSTKCEALAKEYASRNQGEELRAAETFAGSSLLWKMNALLILKENKIAEDFLIAKLKEYERLGLKKHLGTINWLIAQVQMENRNYDQALLYFKKAIEADKQAKYYFGCKQSWNSLGAELYFDHLKDPDKALACYRQALRYNISSSAEPGEVDQEDDTYETLNIYTGMARAFVQKNAFDSAFFYFQLAFDQLKPGLNERSILYDTPEQLVNHKKIYYLIGLVISKGDAFRKGFLITGKQQLLNEAIAVYKAADQLLSRIRIHQSDLRSKLYWRRDSRRLYEQAIDACYLAGKPGDAFYFFEKSRAVLLTDQLNAQRWTGEGDIFKQAQLKKRIQSLENDMKQANVSDQQLGTLKNEVFSAKQELDRLEESIRVNNPLYYQSFLDTGFITLKYLQDDLDRNRSALLELFSGDSAVYVLEITSENCYLNKIDKRDYESTTNTYISYISNADLLNKDYSGFTSISSRLYNLIFRQAPRAGRVVISPDGQYFPFESLVVSKPGQPLVWFLNDHAVTYTYSARFQLSDFTTAANGKGKSFVGFAPVNFSGSSLPALAGSDHSLKKIATFFDHPTTLSAAKASRNNFLGQYPDFKVIQLYTHAADNSSFGEPVIYFADSALYLSELIGDQRPLTRLIVLSACETGRGENYKGEGVFSFNRGFAALGIPAAITNLWSVDNASTYELTELFYKWAAKGLSTDIALQKAKLEFLQKAGKEKSMPFYWAAPVLVGKADIISTGRPVGWPWLLVLFGVIAPVALFWYRKRRSSAIAKAIR